MTDGTQSEQRRGLPVVSWVDFLQDHPPSSAAIVTDSIEPSGTNAHRVATPTLLLYCEGNHCGRRMLCNAEAEGRYINQGQDIRGYLDYNCRNCGRRLKSFAVVVAWGAEVVAYKFGELPPFGPFTPPRVIKMIGPDRDLFLHGRRSESHGLGIGAFTYYRRVVENQWSRIVDEIIHVARGTGASPAALRTLQDARSEDQFSKSVEEVKNAIPPSLLINGHNPLLLLHSALSQGVHKLRDGECLRLATSVRTVLAELAEKLSQTLKDDKKLKVAVKELLDVQARKKAKKP